MALMGALALMTGERAGAAVPVAALGSAEAQAGATVTLPFTITKAIINVAGLNLTLRVTTEVGAPVLAPTFSLGAQTGDWRIAPDEQDPWHVTLVNSVGVKGPAELAKVSLQVSPSVLPGTVYTLEAAPAILGDEGGQERDISALVAVGQVTVPFLYGDVTRDRLVNSQDLALMAQMLLGQRAPNAAELRAGDTRPRPGTEGRAFGDGMIRAADLNWLFRRTRGLVTNP
jgi:hypothetical protein